MAQVSTRSTKKRPESKTPKSGKKAPASPARAERRTAERRTTPSEAPHALEARLHDAEVALATNEARHDLLLSELRRELAQAQSDLAVVRQRLDVAGTEAAQRLDRLQAEIDDERRAAVEGLEHAHRQIEGLTAANQQAQAAHAQVAALSAKLSANQRAQEALAAQAQRTQDEHAGEMRRQKDAFAAEVQRAQQASEQIAALNEALAAEKQRAQDASDQVAELEKTAAPVVTAPVVDTTALEAALTQTRAALAAETQRASDARNEIMQLKSAIRDVRAESAHERMLARSAQESAARLTEALTAAGHMPPLLVEPAPPPAAPAKSKLTSFVPEIGSLASPAAAAPKPKISVTWAEGETELDLPRGASTDRDIFHRRRRRFALVALALCGLGLAVALAWDFFAYDEGAPVETSARY